MPKHSFRYLSCALALALSISALGKEDVQAKTKASDPIPEIVNIEEISKALKLAQFKGKNFTRKIKIAIIDNGFNGYQDEIGKSLPADTQYHQGKASEADKISVTSYHGLLMAKIVAGMIKSAGAESNYELHLFNGYGYTKFADAIDSVIHDGIDLVLYCQVWEFGGNGDGKGFINAQVDKAIKNGIVWINAAGNFGHLTQAAPVDGKLESLDNWVMFKDRKNKSVDSTKLYCVLPAGQKCSLRLVLTWNDFKDDSALGTDKDLDLFLHDSKGTQIASSEFRQVLEAKEGQQDDNDSMIPRELIVKDIDPGEYKVRVKIISKNFDKDKDVLKITASGEGVSMDNPTLGETLLPPADNAGVIDVGAADDLETSTSLKSKRPEIYLRSLVKLKDGSNPFSTSVAAALAASVAVLDIGTGTDATRAAVLTKLKAIDQPAPPATFEAAAKIASSGEHALPATSKAKSETAQTPPGMPASNGVSAPRPRLPGRQVAGQGRCYAQVQDFPFSNYDGLSEALSVPHVVAFNTGHRVALAVDAEFLKTYGIVEDGTPNRVFITPAGLRLVTPDQMSQGLPENFVEVYTGDVVICRD